MDDSQIQSETSDEWIYTFQGTSYIVCITVSSRVLNIQLEDAENGNRWSADFTAQYIEELTLKAGNYKKFGVFTTMLMSAFAKNSESVYVDLLTHSDIVVLKAKKSGIDTSQISHNDAMRRSSQHKRYLVLTYTGEFDRVHYPLPLSFEETPNAIALQKTIRRLRAKLKEKRESDLEPSSEREKELRQIVAQLRQDNTELRHRMRHAGKAAAAASKSDLSLMMSPGTQTLLQADLQAAGGTHSNAELARDNVKLRKQNEELKRQVKESAIYIEKLKTEHARDITKWKSRLGGVSLVDAVSDRDFERRRAEEQVIAELKRRIMGLERELKNERLSRGRPSSTASRRSVPSRSASPVSSSITNARIRHNSGSPANVMARHGTNGASTRTPRLSNASSSSHYSSQAHRSNSPQIVSSHRYQSPQRANSVSRQVKPANNSFNHEMSPSSSLGGRFDPTAYHRFTQQQQQQEHHKQKTTKRKSSSTSYRYEDNGYSSAGSRESEYSRSQRSVRSANSLTSQHSRQKESPYSDSERGKTRKYSNSSSKSKPSTATIGKDGSPAGVGINIGRRRDSKKQFPYHSASPLSGSDNELDNRSIDRRPVSKSTLTSTSSHHKPSPDFHRKGNFIDENEISVNHNNQDGNKPTSKVKREYIGNDFDRHKDSKDKSYEGNSEYEFNEMHSKFTDDSSQKHVPRHLLADPLSHVARNDTKDRESERAIGTRANRSHEFVDNGTATHTHKQDSNSEIVHKVQQLKKNTDEKVDTRVSSSGNATLRRSREEKNVPSTDTTYGSSSNTNSSELSDIDKRIQALHSFLEAARGNVSKSGST